MIALRRAKSMVIDATDPNRRSAGSFFTNPILHAEGFAELERRVAERLGADVTPPRLLLRDHPIADGVIRLWPDEAVTAGLGIAEGIETALSLAHGFTPVWACIDAGHLAKFPVLPGVQDLIIAADNDDAGRKAANECATRWAAHAAVRVIQADEAGCDLNDMVQTWVK